ncbi:MAG TPA: glycogen synthase GlgA [Blastocatellia bacterium]|nr:glycogen synthase GlgA [Blastocatellia bacterium]
MKIVLVSSEAVPYSKTGGLADVCGALPKALKRLGVDIRVILPRYTGLSFRHGDVVSQSNGYQILADLAVPFAGGVKYANVYEDWLDDTPFYFIDNPEYFARGYIYGSGDSDVERFAFFSRAALELTKQLGAPPDVIHCNDWQTGLLPAYLESIYRADPYFARTATLFSIHNLAYQGQFNPALLSHIGLSSDVYQTGLEFHGVANSLKSGLFYATGLSTVSRKYAEEIQTPEYGNQLDGLLRWRRGDLIGILNGVDYDEWNPAHDPHIVAHFSPDHLAGKRECKRALLRYYHLPEDLDRPLLGIITRLTTQKGIDLLANAIWRILDTGAMFVLLGSGAQSYEDYFQHVRDSRPQQVGVYFGYNTARAHQIEAGADMYLMPSAYEPCGLNQMYSLKYGTVPIVRGVGGLDDTITNYERATKQGNGFKFYDYSVDRFVEKFLEAYLLYDDKEEWLQIQRNGMLADHSWERAAREYMSAYETLARTKR